MQGVIKSLLSLTLCILTVGILGAQLNPKDIYLNGKEDNSVSFQLVSQGFQPNVVVQPAFQDTFGFDPLGGGVYEFTYVPQAGFKGDVYLTIEYYESLGIPGLFIPNYTTVHYRIETSKLDCEPDHVLAPAGLSTEHDVLLNDNTTDGTLSLVRLGLVTGGSANIVNDKIAFTPDADADYGYVRYFTSDGTANVESSVLYITPEDDQRNDSRWVYVNKLSSIQLFLNSSSYAVATPPQHGNLAQNGHIWTYDPANNYSGQDNIVFTSPSGGTIAYAVTVLDKQDNKSFVQDDRYYVVTNGEIEFNVFDNDFRDEFNIIDYSSELLYNGNGNFSYTPPADFTGDQVFFYKIFAGFQFHTGQIVIHVDDFAPDAEVSYDFTILNNHDLVVNHISPAGSYELNLVNAPADGSVTVLDANGQQVLNCETIEGENTVIYTPNPGFSGVDFFDIEYCTSTGICETVAVHVDVLSSNYQDCLCLIDCMHQGDVNNDGQVNRRDLLSLALDMGEGGPSRTNDFDLFWTGQYSNNWNYIQLNRPGTDLKTSDSDGNGYIDILDIEAVEDNYASVHNFVPSEIGLPSDVPVTFIPQSEEVDSGEWMFIDIYAGSMSDPALDFYGLSLSFNIDPDIIDSSSVSFELYADGWMAYNAPLYDLVNVPSDGKVDLAISRVNNVSVDGIGIIGTLGFIVEEDVFGVKRTGTQEFVTRQIRMEDIVSVGRHGDLRKHPDYIDDIRIRLSEEEYDTPLADHVSVYPNPTSGFLQLVSDRFTIEQIQVFDLNGRTVMDQRVGSYRSELDFTTLQEGIYFVRMFARDQVHTVKVQKFDR